MLQRAVESTAVGVTLVAGSLHLEELGCLWMFRAMAALVAWWPWAALQAGSAAVDDTT